MAVRCVHESRLHESNMFVTLTYSDEALERFAAEGGNPYSLHYPHFQEFMKRFRFHMGPARFFMCGEYGEQRGRPHFHAIIFGHWMPDSVLIKESRGNRLYSSVKLEEMWSHGLCSFGNVTMESAQYVARYAQKSLVPGEDNFQRRDVSRYAVDPDTGECWFQVPEFIRMSNGGGRQTEKAGGIGKRWFLKYSADVFGKQAEPALDRVIINGVAAKPPKYYDVLLGRESEYRLDYVKFCREVEALRRGDSELTPARLLQREAVARARLLLKKRGVK